MLDAYVGGTCSGRCLGSCLVLRGHEAVPRIRQLVCSWHLTVLLSDCSTALIIVLGFIVLGCDCALSSRSPVSPACMALRRPVPRQRCCQ